jgi:membrane associated rhomboid family serine protease
VDLTKLRSKRPRYRTLEIAPKGTISSDSRIVSISLKPDEKLDPLVYWVIGTACALFLFDSLDLFTSSTTIRKLIIDSINWGTLYQNFFPERFWTPVTSMWYHSTWEHLLGNMIAFYISALWLSRVFDAKVWRFFFFIGGPLAGVAFVFANTCLPADFAHWHGPLAAITGQANTPLAGASGGCFAMIGATLAAAVRYRIAGVKSWMQVSLTFLLALPVLQFIFVDWGNSGIAGLAHQLALVFGFLLGLLPRLRGTVSILTSAPSTIVIESVTVDDRNRLVVGAVCAVTSDFDDEGDFLVKRQDYIGYNNTKPSYKLIGGNRPPDRAPAVAVALNLKLCRVSSEAYKAILKRTSRAWIIFVIYIVGGAALCQLVFAKYSAANYPSIFVANLLFGLLIIAEFMLTLRSTLKWDAPSLAPLPTEMSIGSWQ